MHKQFMKLWTRQRLSAAQGGLTDSSLSMYRWVHWIKPCGGCSRQMVIMEQLLRHLYAMVALSERGASLPEPAAIKTIRKEERNYLSATGKGAFTNKNCRVDGHSGIHTCTKKIRCGE